MEIKVVSGIMLTLLLTSMFTFAFNIQPVRAEPLEPPITEWNKTYGGAGGDSTLSVEQTDDGGYIAAGATDSFGAGVVDFWLVKVNANGNLQWNKTYGGAGGEEALSVQQTSDGGYIVAGETYSFGAGYYDFWLVKTDADGNMEWNKTYGGADYDGAWSVQQTSDGGYIAAGYTSSFGAGAYDFWLIKTDASGNMEWNKTYGGASTDWGHSVEQTSDEGYIVAGYTGSFGLAGVHFWLVKTDAAGNMEWNKTYGASGEVAYSVQQTTDGGYIAAGITGSFGAGNDDFWLVKTDPSGTMVWNRTYGGAGGDWAYSVQQTGDGGYIVAGGTSSFGAGSYDVWLVKTDANGNMGWNKTYGGAGGDMARSVKQTSDRGYIVAGGTSSFGAGSYDVWLIKLAPPTVVATADVVPNTLNLKSKGKWITCYIELPKGYNVSDIYVSTIMLNDSIPISLLDVPAPESVPTEIGDYDSDGIPDLMVKFNRTMVSEFILSKSTTHGNVTLTITGEVAGMPFEGGDSIRVLFPSTERVGRGGCRGYNL